MSATLLMELTLQAYGSWSARCGGDTGNGVVRVGLDPADEVALGEFLTEFVVPEESLYY